MKQNLTVQIQEEARNEILNAYFWYEEKSLGLGKKFITELDEAFKTIVKSPKGYQKFYRHRQFPLEKFPFIILFEATPNVLYIDAVFHTSQDPLKKIR
ncbi:MAG: type II toxin-antitoxin system RelE/ParE family toxin [Crocinitomicaceae bacterium]|nr:type II toxin-antitoxin system RelE/ParE family toxin [Crocinitomicaceae bacterium]